MTIKHANFAYTFYWSIKILYSSSSIMDYKILVMLLNSVSTFWPAIYDKIMDAYSKTIYSRKVIGLF